MSRLPLVIIPQHFGGLVFDRRTSRYHPFDREASDLLGREPVYEVLAGAEDPEWVEAGERFYGHFERMGWFTLEGRLPAATLDLQPPPDHLVGPLALHLEVVAACNLTCTHCFAGTLPRRETPLTLAELDRLFGEMARLGTFRLGLTGGEPLLRKDLFEILDLALSHGLCPCLTTNGLLITEEIARELGRRELVWLNVSLDGATAESNDRVRGAGTFDRVLERLEVLHRHARFTLAFTLMSNNRHEVRAYAELAERVGAGTAVFRPLYPVGTARQHPELMPSFAEYQDALTTLAGMGAEGAFDFRPIDPFSPHLRSEKQSVVHQNYGCGAGQLVCSVSVSGQVNPCSFLGPAFEAGNVRERSLEEIWREGHSFRRMRALPDVDPASPHGNNARFAGGCRARALVLNGSIEAPDPWIEDVVGRGPGALNPLVVLDVDTRRG